MANRNLIPMTCSLILISYLFSGILMSGGNLAFAESQKLHHHSNRRIIQKLPRGSREIIVRGKKYYHSGGIFFQRGPSGFWAVHPPVGTFLWRLPVGATALIIGGFTYYVFDDVYYRATEGRYVVCEPPNETAVAKEVTPVVPSKESAGGQVTVTASLLNIRSGPGSNFPVIAQAHGGDVLLVQGYAPEWYYIKTTRNQFGWVMIKFTSSNSSATDGSSG